MFFVLSKTLDLLIAPLTWGFLLALLGAWGMRRKRPRLAKRAFVAALGVVWLFSLYPVGNGVVRVLEASATTTFSPEKTYDVVVVLGGMSDPGVISVTGEPEFNEEVDRILAGYDLVRRGQARNVLVTSEPLEAPPLGKQLADWGVPPEKIFVEARSRNTRDNATGSAAIIREHGWSQVLLVTSALHMPRAEGCFRAAGLTFDTLSVDRRGVELTKVWWNIAPRAGALDLSTTGIREAVGRLVYRIVGYAR